MNGVNVERTRTGRLRPVCESCGRRGRSVATDRLTLWELAAGWSCAPYPEGFQHQDGSTGTRFICPTCTRHQAA